jgi:hypothetical protein
MELRLPHLVLEGLKCRSGGVELRQHLRPDWGRGRPVLPALGVQPTGRVVEAVVLPE